MGFKRLARGFDVKLILALITLVVITTVCYLGIAGSRQHEKVVNSLSATTGEVERLTAQLDAQSAQLDALKVQAAKDARKSGRDIRAMRAQNGRLLAFLRELGIEVPESVIAPRSGGSGGTDPKAQGPRGPKPSPSPPPASPGPPPATPSPSPGVLDLVCGLLPALCPLI